MLIDQRLLSFLLLSLGLHASLLAIRREAAPVSHPSVLEVRLEAAAPSPLPAAPLPESQVTPRRAETSPAPVSVPVTSPVAPVLQPAPVAPAPIPQAVPAPTAPAVPARVEKIASGGDSTAIFDAAYLRNPPPDYPPQSRRLEEEGVVKLRVRVSAEGRAVAIELAQSSGFKRLDAAAQEAVGQWRFVPARRDGQAVEATVIVPVRFALNE